MSHHKAPSHYHTLGVDASISAADLARQYKKLSLALHPDRAAYRNATPTEEAQTQQQYQQITEAYMILSDPDKRKTYDTQQGVNLKSRAAAVHDRISAHNTQSHNREEGSSTQQDKGAHGKRGRSREEIEEPEEDEDGDDDDDDDEYEPEMRHSSSHHATRGGKQLFFLRSHRSTSGLHLAQPRLRTCILNRDSVSAPWGVSFGASNNHVVDFDKTRYAALPCPARVLTIAGLPLRDGEDNAVALLQDSLAQQLSVTLQLEYYVDEWELVGDVDRLTDEAVLQQLVARENMAPVLVLPRARSGAHEVEEVVVVSVNGEAVLSSTALRQALQKNANQQILLQLSYVPTTEKRTAGGEGKEKKSKMHIYN